MLARGYCMIYGCQCEGGREGGRKYRGCNEIIVQHLQSSQVWRAYVTRINMYSRQRKRKHEKKKSTTIVVVIWLTNNQKNNNK